MKTLSPLRASLLASALLLSTAFGGLAHAQSSYASTSAASAPALPDLRPEDIARDVKREFNQRSRTEEFVGPTFDPFEEDQTMAGSVNLRHVDGAVTAIDGQVLRGGTLLDISFFYSAPSDDPFDMRGFNDAVFLSGSIAPAVKRDNRILECSRNVQDIVYDHTYYSTPIFLNFGYYRPYRHYSGHRGFGRHNRPYWRNRSNGRYDGWGRSFPRRGYGYNRHDNRYDRRGDSRRNDNRDRDRSRDRVRDRDQASDRNRDRDRSRDRDRTRRSNVNAVRADDRGRMMGTGERRPRAVNTDRNRRDRRNNARSNERREDRANRNRDRDRARNNRNQDTRTQTRTPPRQDPPRVSRARPDMAVSTSKHPQGSARSTPRVRSEPKRRSAPAPKARSAPKSQPKRSQPKNNRPSRTDKGSRVLNFFSGYSTYSRDVVRSVDVDCAREEMLSVFIPNDRLSAARFDGLTLLALDGRGQEYPIFIPPNYIEGFQLAAKGGFSPSAGRILSSTDPSQRSGPRYAAPVQPNVTAAACPAGTSKQADGSCMIVSNRYPQ